MSWSAVAPDAVLVVVRASAEVVIAPDAESWVTEVAVLGTPRMKLPPVAATTTATSPDHDRERASPERPGESSGCATLCRWFTMDRR